jgi:hypothetical protein
MATKYNRDVIYIVTDSSNTSATLQMYNSISNPVVMVMKIENVYNPVVIGSKLEGKRKKAESNIK